MKSALLLGAVLLCGTASIADAQKVTEVRITDANGQFDLWLPTPKRPDDNYTNGAQLYVVVDAAPIWGPLLARHTPICGAAGDSTRHACLSTDFAFGQDMYTPHTALIETGDPIPGERPYAGWLYVAGTGRIATPYRSDAVTLDLGVTGPPSLGEAIQTAWHSAIGFPTPLGWQHQIPFEPGVIIDYSHDQEIWRARVDDVSIFSLVPYGGASVGSVLDAAHVGFETRTGYAVTTPWGAADPRHPGRIQVYIVAGLREDWVGYNLFLDHGTVDPALRVSKTPWVTQWDFGLGLRVWKLEGELRGTNRTREYATGPAMEPYAIASIGWRGVP
jgi:lipid A 3-O-deacylase